MVYILALALGLRLVLFNQSLWLDESIQALALMGRMGPLLQYALADFQPPLYHFLGALSTSLLGYSEISLRVLSLLAGVMTVYYIHKIGDHLGGYKVGVLAGLLSATNPLLIYYSQEGRTYALTTFLVTASFYYFFMLLKNPPSPTPPTPYSIFHILYSVFTVLYLWTSYLSWFVLLTQGLIALTRRRSDLFWLQLGSGLTLLLYLPSLLTSLGIGVSTLVSSPQWGAVVGGISLKSLPLTWVKFVIGRISFDHKLLYGLIVSLIGLIHLYVLRQIRWRQVSVLTLWGIVPITLSMLTALVLPVYSYFRLLFVLPAYLLLLALGLSRIKGNTLSIVLVLVQLLALGYFWFTPRFHKEDWRSLVADLPSDARLAMPSRSQNAPLLYYGWNNPIIEPSREAIEGETIHYIRYVEDLFDPNQVGQANLRERGYTITQSRSYPGIALDIYEKN